MTGGFVSRRRAEEFDALLSAARTPDPAYADLLELVAQLQAVPAVTARPDFVSDLRSQLVVEAARQARPVVDDALRLRLTPNQRRSARERRVASLLGGFAIVAASGSMAMASQSALPGDVLYPVKRALENAHTNLQSNDAAKAETLISHAQQRLQEAEQLTAEGADGSTIAETLQDFTDQSNQAAELSLDDYRSTGDEKAIGDLRSFTADSMGQLTQLGDVVPTDARPALIAAAQTVLQADTAAFQACPTCGDGGVTQLPAFASQPAALHTPMLSLQDSYLSVPVSPHFLDFLDKVQNAADNTDLPTLVHDHSGSTGGDESTSDPAPVIDEPGSDDPVDGNDVTDPLQDLGNRIKIEVNHHGTTDLDPTDDIEVIVDGVPGLVDGISGN